MNDENLVPQSKRTKSEQRKIAKMGGEASAKARRERADIRKLMALALDSKVDNDDLTHAQKLVVSQLQIAEDTDNGTAAVAAFKTILHIIGQDDPEPRQDALDLLREILEGNRKNAELHSESETE